MVDLPRSKREVISQAITSSRNLPQPSGARIRAAGAVGRGIANIGDTLQRIGIQQLRIQRDIEVKNATLDADQGYKQIILDNSKKFENAAEFQAQTTKDITSLFDNIKKKRGLVVGRELDLQLKAIQNKANVAITAAGLKKTQDNDDALFIRVRDDAVNTALIGVRGGDPDAINKGMAKIQDLLDRQVLRNTRTLKQREQALKEARKDLALGKFNIELQQNPNLAFQNLQNNLNISEELRISVFDKAVTRISKQNKLRKEARKIDRDNREREYRKEIRENPDFDIDDLARLEEKNSDNPLSVPALIRTENFLNKVEEQGGIGNPKSFNALELLVEDNPDMFRQTDVYGMADAEGLNGDEAELLVNAWAKALQGTDPDDPTLIKRFKEITDSLKADFPINEIDVDGFITQSRDQDAALRYSKAWARNEANTTRKNFELIAEEARLATLEFMDKRAKTKTSIRENQSDDLSAFELEQRLPSFEAPPISPLVESFREFLKAETKEGEVAKLKPEEQPKLDLLRLELNTIMQQALDDFDAGIIDNTEFERITDEAANAFEEETKKKEEIKSEQ